MSGQNKRDDFRKKRELDEARKAGMSHWQEPQPQQRADRQTIITTALCLVFPCGSRRLVVVA